MRRDDAPEVRSIVASDGVDGFKDSDLHNRCKSRLGERVLAIRNGCVYRNYVPVQDRIGFCDGRPEQQSRHQHTQAKIPLSRATTHLLHCASPNFHWPLVSDERHSCGRGLGCPYVTACRDVIFCVALSGTILCIYTGACRCVLNFSHPPMGVSRGFPPSTRTPIDPARRWL